uniref:Ig-like domain-containing protein n=1 Tax=Acrobeloides nanus TaxID=290746 RepID=A0A914DRX4_9BILA
MRFFILTIALFVINDYQGKISDAAYTFGNLNVILKVPDGISTVENPHRAEFNKLLWCQANEDANTILPIDSVLYRHEKTNQTFDQTTTPPVQLHDEHRALLNFTGVPLTEILSGKYVCHINSTNDIDIHGNQFVYIRPFFHFNDIEAKLSHDDEPFNVIGTTLSTNKGNTVTFPCPAAGGPNLTVTWERNNGLPEKHQRNGFDLIIPDVDESDEGEYRCIATATVKNETKSPEYVLEATLTHYLKKVTSYIFDEESGLSDDATQTEDANNNNSEVI